MGLILCHLCEEPILDLHYARFEPIDPTESEHAYQVVICRNCALQRDKEKELNKDE